MIIWFIALNKKDLQDIDKLIAENSQIILEAVDDNINESFKEFRSEIKNEMHNIVDPVMKEIKTSREELQL